MEGDRIFRIKALVLNIFLNGGRFPDVLWACSFLGSSYFFIVSKNKRQIKTPLRVCNQNRRE